MRRLPSLTAVLAAVAALAAPATAEADFFFGDTFDGPSADIQSVGDVDLARDGTGALAYVKRDGGADHVFLSRFTGGVFQAPVRLDGTLTEPSSQPVLGASNEGRLVIAFVNAGVVYAVSAPPGSPFSEPLPLAPGVDPAADVSINGTAFVTFTSGGDVRVARYDPRTNAFTLLEQPLDAFAPRDAGTGSGRSRVASSADGVGVATWGEAGHIYARKMFNTGVSDAVQDLTPAEFQGGETTTSSQPDIDAEDDSNYAWVVFRQDFADGSSRILARRQRGTVFEPAVALDAGDEPADAPRIDLNGRGVGMAGMAGLGSRQPIATVLERDTWNTGERMASPSLVGPLTVPSVSENNSGFAAAIVGGAGNGPIVRVRPFVDGDSKPEKTISRPELGAVDPALGFDSAADRAGGVVWAWVQDGPDGRRIVTGYFDRPPLSFAIHNSQRCCQPRLPRLTWQPAFNLWGPLRYRVHINGKLMGETTDTFLQLTTPLRGPTHRLRVTAIDIRGQMERSRTRLLRIDDVAPRQGVSLRRRGRVVTLAVRARDPNPRGRRASGLRGIRVAWGDGAVSRGGFRLRTSHRYRRSGFYTVAVTSTDRAGNAATFSRTVRIG